VFFPANPSTDCVFELSPPETVLVPPSLCYMDFFCAEKLCKSPSSVHVVRPLLYKKAGLLGEVTKSDTRLEAHPKPIATTF